MTYETVIGLEVHIELSTESKLFCGCSAKFGAEANENVCPACCGMPGMPAVLNKKAVELGIAAGILTNSEITPVITFDKKNYFYPDLPTGYQITQLNAPICKNGRVKINPKDAPPKTITLKQIHIEEDAGKLVHERGVSLVDYNRAGVPLAEVVSNPDFRNAEEVCAYLEKLRSLFSFAGVSDCKMQEGSMRCDVNISVRKAGEETLGVRTEIKNMNSIKAITAAIEYETERHIDALTSNTETLIQETRGWDDANGITYSLREKETAADYRYFPNPEVLPVKISEQWIEQVRKSLPETADAKFERLTQKLGLSDYDAGVITTSKNLSRIFDETYKYFNNAKEIANWIISELLNAAKGDNKTQEDIDINCERFAKLMELTVNKTINRNTAKSLLVLVLKENIDPESYIKEHGLGMVADTGLLENTVKEVLGENQKTVLEYKNGSTKVIGFLIGQVMKKTGGKADPGVVSGLVKKCLEGV